MNSDLIINNNEGILEITFNRPERKNAISRAMFEKIPINLVSAVPSVETYNNIKLKKYEYSRILKRYNNANLPEHEIIDLKKHSL